MNKMFRDMEYLVRDDNTITGKPIVFESLTDLGTHYEIIKRGALDNCDLSDISLLINHNFDMLPLARYRQGKESTISIDLNDECLGFESTLDPSNPRSAEALSSIRRGDIQKMSFGFLLSIEDTTCCHWIENRNDKPTLVITHIDKVFDISIVTWPAYDDTSVSMKRSKEIESEEFDVFENYRNNLDLLKLKILAMYC